MEASGQTEQLKKENLDFATRLSEMMDGLPLALDQAGAYIQETQISVKEYVKLYTDQARSANLLQKRGEDIKDHPESVATTFILSFDHIKRKDLIAAHTLYICAFLHPDAIPEEFLLEAISMLSETEKMAKGEEIETIKVLLRYSLLRRNSASKTFTIHRLLQAVLKNSLLVNEQQQWAEQTISLLNRSPIPFDEAKLMTGEKRQQRSLAQLYLPHALVCLAHMKMWHIQSAEAVELLNRAGAYAYQRGKYAEAQLLYEQLFSTKQSQASVGLDKARNLSILANLIYLQKVGDKKKYSEAVQRYQEALRIYEQKLAQNDPQIGQILTHYALLLQRLKRREEAESVTIRARQISKHMTEKEKDRWRSRWVGNLDYVGCGIAAGRGLIFLITLGLPIALGLITQSWWWGWGSFAAMFAGFMVISSPQRVRYSRLVWMGIYLYFLILSLVIGGFDGWMGGKNMITAWHMTYWPLLLQFIIQGACVLFSCIIAFFGFFLILYLQDELVENSKYREQGATPDYATILSTITFLFSLLILPILLGLLLHSWWIFALNLLGLWILFFMYTSVSIYNKAPRFRNITICIIACLWGWLGWMSAEFLSPHIQSDGWQQALPFVLTLAAFGAGFFCHSAAFRQFFFMGSEGNIPFVLEDLWINTDVVAMLNAEASTPIKNWESFYSLQGNGYRQQKRYADAIVHYTLAILNAPH